MNPIFRPGLMLGLACLVPAASGCHSLGVWPASKPDTQNENTAAQAGTTTSAVPAMKTDLAPGRTEFRREVTPLQQFNVHLEVGRAQEAQEHFEEAVGEYQKAIDASQKHGSLLSGATITAAQRALAHRRIGAALDHLGRFAQSEVHYRAALELSPDDPKVWNDAGYSCYLQGRWDDAVRDLKMADKLDPGNPRVQTNLGLALAASGKEDDALTALSRAGGHAIGHANMAFLMAAQGKTDLARKHYQSALALKPDLTPARQALAALDARIDRANQRKANAAPPDTATTSTPAVITLSPPARTPIPTSVSTAPASTVPPAAATSATANPTTAPSTTALRMAPTAPAPEAATVAIPATDSGLERSSASAVAEPQTAPTTPAPSAQEAK
ncbi:MAG: tetratricopeptide repeat protein [Planctomycetaceae bacterium]